MPSHSARSTRNPEETKRAIFEAAQKEFAAFGFEGARVDHIVRKSGYNKRMVYHYFGDKRGLYRALIGEHWIRLQSWMMDASAKDMPKRFRASPVPSLLLWADQSFRYFSENLDFVRLMMWEALEGGEISNSLWEDVRGPMVAVVCEEIRKAQRQGLVSKSLSAEHLVVSFLGAISFYFAYASSLQDIVGDDPLSEKALRQRRRQLLLFVESLVASTAH